ncbi:hypothetical protein BU61_8654 [Pontoporia blainvillei]|uniref:Ras-associating domain-containing protein n=1 Tax=Pontoporia blainvillei TaxID=48723 RepID=A0ABX0S6I3_PONBL|nr:hypothetical protein [Pontoporia blainvillei]
MVTRLSFSPRTRPLPCRWPEPLVLILEDGPTMFYGTHFIMSPPAKSKLKWQGQLLSSVLSRTLSYKYRDLDATCSSLGTSDDPAELSTQLSAPGVLKVFGDSVCTGTHYKSVLATGTSSARELVREALERYALSPERAGQYVLCDVVGQAGDSGRQWQAEGFRVFGDNEKPLLIQELWKPREGLSRRFELRKRSEVEELAARDVDTVTAVPWGDFCFWLKMTVQGSGMRVIGRREDLVPCRRHTRCRECSCSPVLLWCEIHLVPLGCEDEDVAGWGLTGPLRLVLGSQRPFWPQSRDLEDR